MFKYPHKLYSPAGIEVDPTERQTKCKKTTDKLTNDVRALFKYNMCYKNYLTRILIQIVYGLNSIT